MTTCEICGRPVEGVGMFSEAHVDPAHFDDCYRIGYEREKARADALARQVERIVVLAAELHDERIVVLNHHKDGMAAAAAWVDTCRDATP